MPILKPPPGRAHAPAPGRSGLWLFNEHAGSAVDLSGNRRDLTFNGSPSRTAGPYGPEVTFPASGDYNPADSLTGPASIPVEWKTNANPSLSVLLNAPTTMAANIAIVTNTDDLFNGWGLVTLAENRIAWFVQFVFSGVTHDITPGYHAITGTYDYAAGTKALWVDGRLIGTQNLGYSAEPTASLRVSGFPGWGPFRGGMVAMQVADSGTVNVPKLHSDWLSGRFLDDAAPVPLRRPSIPIKLHHYKQMGAA
jgi:hypothetical protein